MNFEKLKKLASLLDKQHGTPNRHGFVVAPHSESQLAEHRKALTRTDRIFDYQPITDEKCSISAFTRQETVNEDQSILLDYAHTRLEHMELEALATPEISPLLAEYIEYIKSRPS